MYLAEIKSNELPSIILNGRQSKHLGYFESNNLTNVWNLEVMALSSYTQTSPYSSMLKNRNALESLEGKLKHYNNDIERKLKI